MKRSRDVNSRDIVGRGMGHHRAHSPHQSRDVPAAGARHEGNILVSREIQVVPRDVHGDREGRRQHDRRDVTLSTSAATATNNIRQRRESPSDSSAGIYVCYMFSVYVTLSVCHEYC